MAILEMLAMGKPVVAADISGTGEMISNGGNGYLVQPRHVEALVDRLGLLLHDPQSRERFGIAGRQTVLDNFTSNVMVEKTRRVFEETHAK
jgi:glycosyltransferase involved in cell wall biosynthesis